jgi:hypothetical protein
MLFMEKPFTITFSNQVAAVVQVNFFNQLSTSLRALGFDRRSRPVLVVIGGASKLTEADYWQVQRLFLDVLAPIAEKWQACVVDGGTDAGVMRLMGEARTTIAGSFPLIGVTPEELAVLPKQTPTSEEATPLEPSHTHFLLVPGSEWGDESLWIAKVASELAGDAPSVTVLINGGEVTWKDALQNVEAGRVIVVVAGSGRTADQLAAGLRGEPTDDRAHALIESGLVQAVELNEEMDALTSILDEIFAGKAR